MLTAIAILAVSLLSPPSDPCDQRPMLLVKESWDFDGDGHFDYELMVSDICGVRCTCYGESSEETDPFFAEFYSWSTDGPCPFLFAVEAEDLSPAAQCFAGAILVCGGAKCVKSVTVGSDGACTIVCKETPACDPPNTDPTAPPPNEEG